MASPADQQECSADTTPPSSSFTNTGVISSESPGDRRLHNESGCGTCRDNADGTYRVRSTQQPVSESVPPISLIQAGAVERVVCNSSVNSLVYTEHDQAGAAAPPNVEHSLEASVACNSVQTLSSHSLSPSLNGASTGSRCTLSACAANSSKYEGSERAESSQQTETNVNASVCRVYASFNTRLHEDENSTDECKHSQKGYRSDSGVRNARSEDITDCKNEAKNSRQNGDSKQCENSDMNGELSDKKCEYTDSGEHPDNKNRNGQHSDNSGPLLDNSGELSEGASNANSANVDNTEDQHTLAGPERRHQTARRQRRQDANPVSAQSRQITLPESLRAQWREIGAQWGLQDDNEIARVLLRNYEDLMAGRPPRPPPRPRCQGCGEALMPAPCDNCGPNHHSVRLSHHHGDNSSGGGRGGFCGRCRD